MTDAFTPTTDEQIISMLCYAAEFRRTNRTIPDALSRQLAVMVATHGDRLADALEEFSRAQGSR